MPTFLIKINVNSFAGHGGTFTMEIKTEGNDWIIKRPLIQKTAHNTVPDGVCTTEKAKNQLILTGGRQSE